MSVATFDRLVSSGTYFDRLLDVTGSPRITSITGAQEGAAMTLTGTSFSASGNEVFAGDPNDDPANWIFIPIASEGTTSIVTGVLSADRLYLTRQTSFFMRNSSQVASNAVSVTVAPATGYFAQAITQEFLGDATTRIEADPVLSLSDEIRWDNTNVSFTGQGAFSAASSVATFNVAIFDGDQSSGYVAQLLADPVSAATVPDVSALTQAAAEAAITSAGLVPVVVASVPSTTVAQGAVISQFPAAGSSVTGGATVELIISLGASVTIVPDLRGLLQADAETQRTSALLTGVAYRVIDSNNTGRVVNQSIDPGTVVDVNTALDLEISSNLMPDVRGLLYQTAAALIESAGLTLITTLEAFSDSVLAGYVITQLPAVDSIVAPADLVTLTVSLGRTPAVGTLGRRPAITLRQFLLS